MQDGGRGSANDVKLKVGSVELKEMFGRLGEVGPPPLREGTAELRRQQTVRNSGRHFQVPFVKHSFTNNQLK